MLAALCALAGCRQILGIDDGVVAGGPADSAVDEITAPYAPFSKQIDIMSPVVEPLDGFVVPIVRESDADLASHARDDGLDLFFTQNGEVLPFELVRFDGVSGALEAWVRLPSLNGTHRITLHYGGTPITHTASDAWVPDIAGAWHLSPAMNGNAVDSSPHAHAMSSIQAVAPTSVPGISGAGLSFVATQRLDAGDPADGSLDFSGGFSFSLWVRVMVSSGTYDKPLYKGGSSVMDTGYSVELGAGNWNVLLSDGLNTAAASFGSEPELRGSWVQLAAVVDRNSQQLSVYVNGAQRTGGDIAGLGSLANARPFTFGHEMYPYAGLLDEVRVYSTVKGPGWFVAEHAFITSGSKFIEFSSEET